MIGQGLGIGILPERGAQPLVNAMGLKLVKLAEPWARREYAMCMLSFDDLDPPCRRLIEFLTKPNNDPVASQPAGPQTARREAAPEEGERPNKPKGVSARFRVSRNECRPISRFLRAPPAS